MFMQKLRCLEKGSLLDSNLFLTSFHISMIKDLLIKGIQGAMSPISFPMIVLSRDIVESYPSKMFYIRDSV